MAKRTRPYTLEPGRLWPNAPHGSAIEIPVFGATGEYNTGKSLLGHQLAPGVHPEGHPFAGQPRTVIFDLEKSNCTFSGSGAERIDVPDEMLKAYGGKPYGPLETLFWVVQKVETYQPSQRDVMMFDPANDLEAGVAEYIRRNPDKFNMSAEQIRKAGGLFWGAMKDFWKQILLKITARCKTVYFTTHLRDVWQGNMPVHGKREPKGKETLFELATVYLWMEREQQDNAVPSAVVMKQRIADTWIDSESGELQVVDLLPPRLPVATAAAIRGYIANPPDYAKLRDDEKFFEKGLSEDEKLRLQVQMAQAQKETEESRLAQLQRQAELRAMQNQAAANAPQSPDRTSQVHADKAAEKAASVKAEAEAAKRKAEDEELERLKAKVAEDAKKTEEETKRLLKDNDAAGQQPKPEATSETAKDGAAAAEGAGDKATKSQVNEAKAAYVKLASAIPGHPELTLTAERFTEMVSAWGSPKVSDLTREKALQFLQWLETLQLIRSIVVEMAAGKALGVMLERVKVKDIYGLSPELAVKLLERFQAEKAKRQPGN